ncbi:Putative ubiquitin-conjugating enzyme E2-binding protein [Septoria linicola]|uniref:Ubiquitin-conjugating enzyme E2-binding protein n=1 Tax=Septoria linicola TaxID=215465 RepID=A0A9Q9AH88_9PEZI|nr:putative ubiquitin-conjugating enzyme E2-binding protein [Septoria linicola]USW47619.1 Putative ubiquitin-conjugating enzyme E2-binding protein [Septoria linicola]
MTIHLYAEHLLNIRAISIQAALSTASNKETRATLSSDGSLVTLSHEGETASIKLPISIPGGHNAAPLTIPAAPTKDLSFRVQLQQKSDSSGLLTNGVQQDDNIVPWSATSLTTDARFSCVHCRQTLLESGTVRIWKDLPSENWAEMMDFWHCHRPHVPDQNHQTLAKGYSADSTLALAPGVGMVDPVDFVLAREDCPNLQISFARDGQGVEASQLECNSCHTILGHIHTSGGYKLRKLHLALSSSSTQGHESFAVEKWWSCLLLSSIECQGVRKFTAQSTGGSSQGLKLWVFSPDMTVSTSAGNITEPLRASKVFWQDCDIASQDIGALNRQMLAEGELELPPDEMAELRDKLKSSAELLPENARKFQNWKVAILPRFTYADLPMN